MKQLTDKQAGFLKAVASQIGGPLKAMASDRMTSYLLDCLFSVSTRVLVDIGLEDQIRESTRRALSTQEDRLRPILEVSPEGQALLIEVNAVNSSKAGRVELEGLTARVVMFLLKLDSDAALDIARVLIDADAACWQMVQDENEAVRARVGGRIDSEVDAMSAEQKEQLLLVLRAQCGESDQLAIRNIQAVPGGYSKQTIIVTLDHNKVLPSQIVIRRDRAESTIGTTVVNELKLLKLLHESGLKVPKPWLLDHDSVMGCPIMVVSKVDGTTVSDVYTVRTRSRNLALGLAEQLAKLHSIPLEKVPPETPGFADSIKVFMQRETAIQHGQWEQLQERSVSIDAAYAWLENHMDWAEGPRCLIHRDPRFHNILCENDVVTAVLDWELSTVCNPAWDLGWAYHQIVQMMDWEEFLKAYMVFGGIQCSPQSIAFYALWSDLFCAMQMHRVRAGFDAEQSPIAYAYAGEEMRQHGTYILAQRLKQVMTKGKL